jgi:hypothetical protein
VSRPPFGLDAARTTLRKDADEHSDPLAAVDEALWLEPEFGPGVAEHRKQAPHARAPP